MFIVVTKITFSPEEKNKVLEIVRESLPIFHRQPGLKSLSQHLANDQSHTMSYIVWDTQKAHENCMRSSDFDQFNIKWKNLMQSGKPNLNL